MPLLMCPNCAKPTETVRRSGVEFDMCPECRGVWLDRGELEKILDRERGPAAGPWQDGRRDRPDPAWEHEHRSYGGRHGYDEHHGRKRHGLFDLFD